jgi:hypothetical protein
MEYQLSTPAHAHLEMEYSYFVITDGIRNKNLPVVEYWINFGTGFNPVKTFEPKLTAKIYWKSLIMDVFSDCPQIFATNGVM